MTIALRASGVALALVICAAVAPGALAQVPGPDIDRCPDLVGTVSGCPDADDDGIADLDDRCPTVGDRISPDYFVDGCPDAIYGVRYKFQASVRCTGARPKCVRRLRLTQLRVIHIAGYSQSPAVTQVRCQLKSGKTCGSSTVYQPGTRFVISVRSPAAPEAGIIECHRVDIGRSSASASSYRGPDGTARWGADCAALLR